MNSIIPLVIDLAKRTRLESLSAAIDRGDPAPEKLVLTLHDQYRDQPLDPCGETMRTWVSDNDFESSVKAFDVPDVDFDWHSGRTIYPVTQVRFFAHGNRKDVLICEYIGKRYGRGRWYRLCDENDTVSLTPNEDRQQWIS